jgi:hypothetical protein
MKFVSLGKFDKPFRAALESLPKSVAMSHQIHTYPELRQQIHDDLRVQHPEWVEPDGGSPMCDFYEARLMKLLLAATPSVDFQKRGNDKFTR